MSSHDHPNYNNAAEKLFTLSVERLKQVMDDFTFNDIDPSQRTVAKNKGSIYNICYDPRLLDKVAAAGKGGGYPNTEAAGLIPHIDSEFALSMNAVMARRYRLAVMNGGDLQKIVQMGHNDCVGVQILDQTLFDIAHGNIKIEKIDLDGQQMLSALKPHLNDFLAGYETFYHIGDDLQNRLKLMEATTAIKSVLNLSQYFTDMEKGIATVISDSNIKLKLENSEHRTYVSMALCKRGSEVAEHDMGIRIPEIENAFPLSLVKEVYYKKLEGKTSLENGHENSPKQIDNENTGITLLEDIKKMYKEKFAELR